MSPNFRNHAPISPRFREFYSFSRLPWFLPGFNLNGEGGAPAGVNNLVTDDGTKLVTDDGTEIIYSQ